MTDYTRVARNLRTNRGILAYDKWITLGPDIGNDTNVWTSAPELDIAVRNGVNVTLTAEITGVGAACSATTGPAITAECAVAATDLASAYKHIGTVVAHVARTRYSASAVFGQNNANLNTYYARGFLRLKATNTDVANAAYIRIRLWVDLETSTGEHPDVSFREASGDAGADTPFLWCDEMLYLDGTGLAGTSQWTLSAAQTLPMRGRLFAAYTVDYAVVGTGTAEMDFERTAMPTEIDAAWQAMNPTAISLAAGAGYVTRSFAADGTTALAPCGYQRPRFRNIHAANFVAIRVRVWAHLSGS